VEALVARGVRDRAETRGTFFDTLEVAEPVALLRSVDDATDTPSIVAPLRSRASAAPTICSSYERMTRQTGFFDLDSLKVTTNR
jgi:hypothetical protein